MSRFRDFDPEYQAAVDTEPVQFRIGGQEYSCIPEAPSGMLMDIVATMAGGNLDDPAVMGAAAAAATQFFMDALLPDDRVRFAAAIHDPTPGKVIPLGKLVMAMEWVVEQYMGRPTVPPSGSPDWRSQNGVGSMAGSPPAG